MTTLHFLGAAETVTGSKTIIEHNGKKILVDCGLFQGLKSLRERNWTPFPIPAAEIEEVILTHAHLDHCGYLPRLVKEGFSGPIHCTWPTIDLVKIILEDSAKIQEEEADRANEHGYSKHPQAKPLYTLADVQKVLPLLVGHGYSEWVILSNDVKFQLHNAGHILGSAMIEMVVESKTIVFSGDIGTYSPLLMSPPKHLKRAHYIVLESTYGNRLHPTTPPIETLKETVLKADAKNGILIIPTFAVERAQEIIYLLSQLQEAGSIPDLPIYLDSPMGINATMTFLKHPEWHTLGEQRCKRMLQNVHLITDGLHSRAIVADPSPKIVLAGSGMITGGRVLHYLSRHISNPESTVLLAGFQAEGTRGRQLQEGNHEIKFFGVWHPVRAEIIQMSSLSAHGDQADLLKWVGQFDKNLKTIFLNHGEPSASAVLRLKLKDELNIDAVVAGKDQRVVLA